MNGTVQPTANDVFVDRFIANTHSPHDVYGFLMPLLRRPDFLQYYKVVYFGRAWYTTQNYVLPQSPGVAAQHPWIPLDFYLFNRDRQAQLGGVSATHVRTNVSLRTLILIAKGPDLCSPTPLTTYIDRMREKVDLIWPL